MKQLKSSIKRFASDRRGGLSNLMLPMFLLLVLTTGWSIDLILHETERAGLQDAVDRGVLAAASTSQTKNRQEVVQSYVDRRPYARSDASDSNRKGLDTKPDVFLKKDVNSTELSQIEAHAIYDFPTVFANIVMHDSYPVPAVATATEGIEHVELSLVLDISASMAQSDLFDPNTGTTRPRLDILKDAANQFVSDLLGNGTRQRVSISLIPYSGGVNAGPFFDELAIAREHTGSSCISFENGDYSFAGLPPSASRTQVPEFNYFLYTGDFTQGGTSYDGPDDNEWGWCPSGVAMTDPDYRGIIPISRDLGLLQTAINNFAGHDGTGTQVGMKWGLALLDPTTQPIVENLAATQITDTVGLLQSGTVVPADFAGRPFPYNAPGVKKYIVLMTDGNIRYQVRPNPDQLTDPALIEKWSIPGNVTSPGVGYYGPYGAYYPGNVMSRNRNDVSVGGQPLRNIARDTQNQMLSNDETLRTTQFESLCNMAKAGKGIRVFTIGFDISTTQDAYTEMQNCASSPNDYFHSDGDLEAVFREISNLVLSLQLTK